MTEEEMKNCENIPLYLGRGHGVPRGTLRSSQRLSIGSREGHGGQSGEADSKWQCQVPVCHSSSKLKAVHLGMKLTKIHRGIRRI